MNILPGEIRRLLRGHRGLVWLLFAMIGIVAVLESLSLASLLFLGHAVLGQELPSTLGGTFIARFVEGYSYRSLLILLASTFLVLILFRYFLFVASHYLGLKWSSLVTRSLHKRIMHRVISAELRLFSEHQVGEIVHGMVAAPAGATNAIDGIVNSISAIFVVAALGITIAFISPWLSLLTAIVGFLFFALMVRPTRDRVHRYQQQRYDETSQGSKIAADIINGIRDIRAVAAEPTWISAFSRQVELWETAKVRVMFHSFLPGPTLQLALQIIFATAVVIAALILSAESLAEQVAVLGVFAYGLFRIYPAVNQLGSAWVVLAQALPNLRAAEKWTEFPEDTLAHGTAQATLSEGVRFQGVSFSYDGDTPVLDDAHFSIKVGKTTALVGASGAGKSTIIDLMLKFRSPTEGTIWLDNHDLADVDRRSWLDRIGLVRQEVFLFGGTIRANFLAWQPNATEEEMLSACEQAGILEFIQSLPAGLDSIVGDRGITVSGGQRQRLAIARALLRNPDFLILDEATSALDMESEALFLHSLSKNSPSRTTLVISHRVSMVRDADHIIVVDQGRVIEQGTYEELVARHGRYWELFSSQETAGSSEMSDVKNAATD